MKLKDFLNSNLLPRQEKMPDVFSKEPYWALPDCLEVYTDGFNHAEYEKQSKPVIRHLEDMTPEKFDLLMKYGDWEVSHVNIFSANDYKTIVHVQISMPEGWKN